MINLREDLNEGTCVFAKDADSLEPYEYGLEYSSPARGSWNIVHVGLLIPESHQIYGCAQGCLRGVILTVAEMGDEAMDRLSTIELKEHDVFDGGMEQMIIDGVADILEEIDKKPRAILFYTSCMQHFIGCDMDLVYKRLRKKFPEIDFTDCYMNPAMRKSKLSPDATMRRQLYSLLRPTDKKDEKQVNIIGNIYKPSKTSELMQMLKSGGFTVKDICECKTYDEYLLMNKSIASINYYELNIPAGEMIEKKYGQQHIYIPYSYDYEKIEENLKKVADILKIDMIDTQPLIKKAQDALCEAKKEIKDTPIAIDYTATHKPLGLAKLLLEHGFNVTTVYADAFSFEEKNDMEWIKLNAPKLKFSSTVHPKMRIMPRDEAEENGGKLLAIGQKAAYFTGTEYFVNMIESDGYYGFDAIEYLCQNMIESAREKKDVSKIIQVKGWGCLA